VTIFVPPEIKIRSAHELHRSEQVNPEKRGLSLKPSIREFRDYDAREVYALVSDVSTTSDMMSETLEEKFPTCESFQRYMTGLESRPGSVALVAEVDGELCGYLTILPRYPAKLRHTSDLTMGVHHAARGQGIGKLLLKEALQRAQESGVLEIIYLMVRADNTAAIRLYETMGFDQCALLRNDTKTPDGYYDGCLMRKCVRN
jgi:ribosomal protein S18 acetylase RimI-like enzyme